MESYLLDWAGLLLRWLHVVTAIAWIGASFHFVMLDASLVPPVDDELRRKGVDGEFWAVHGGGFYHSNKYLLAPRWRALPRDLHWSYWESYSTWLSGLALFAVLYLAQAASFLVDRTVHDWSSPAVAGVVSLGFLIGFWLVYDGVCRAWGQRRHGERIVAALVVVAVVAATWLACRLYAGRAAFVLVGAMLATAMSANVFFCIIPGQRKVVAALQAGEAPDPRHGRRGKQRSVHNTYFTLPVIVAMLSNHYGWLVQAQHNGLVLLVLMAAGALVRHSFVARHRARREGRRTPWQYALAGVALLALLVPWMAPAPAVPRTAAATPTPTYAAVRRVLDERCVACHNARLASKNVALESAEDVRRHAQAIHQQAALLKLMPLNNATGMTADERALIGRWFASGAPVEP